MFELGNVPKVRKTIEEYCVSRCDAFCCRFSNSYGIELTVPQFESLCGKRMGKINTHYEPRLDPLTGEIYSVILREQCPRLNGHLCGLVNNSRRPQKCIDFPVNGYENLLIIDTHCIYVMNNFEEIISLLAPGLSIKISPKPAYYTLRKDKEEFRIAV